MLEIVAHGRWGGTGNGSYRADEMKRADFRYVAIGRASTEVIAHAHFPSISQSRFTARLKVIRHIGPKLSCRSCQRIIQAPAPIWNGCKIANGSRVDDCANVMQVV